ncbi:MAG TPA: translocation/assembly module TamB domain-containing protein [Longimicrobiales bacterium]|nr:translocation/assembly module TamB domain-containing protein [Longimicrobiales bacterium]
MAERPEGGLPRGVVAALTFVFAALFLLVLFRALGDRGPEPSGVRLEPREQDSVDISVEGPLSTYGGFDVNAFADRVSRRLAPITLRPASALRVTGREVTWADAAGRTLLQAPVLTATVELSDAGVLVRNGVVESPRMLLVESPGGTWNYESVLDPILASGGSGGGPPTAVDLRSILLRDADVIVRRPDETYAGRSLDVQLASARLSGPGVTDPVFRISRAAGVLELPDSAGPIARDVTLEDAVLRLVDGALAFQVGSGTFGESTFASATGVWEPGLGALGLDAVLTVTALRIEDVPWLRGEVPEDASGAFRLAIEPIGERSALVFSDATIRAPGSAATGSVRALYGPAGFSLEAVDLLLDPLELALVEAFTGPLPYSGQLQGRLEGTAGDIGFDVVATLATSPAADPFTTALQGTLAFTDDGIEMRGVAATLDRVPLAALEPIAPGLPLAGPVSGTIRFDGSPATTPIRIDVRLEAGGGIITVAGVLDLRGAEPRYDVEGSIAGVEMRQVLAPRVPPVRLDAVFDLLGVGTDPATAEASLGLNGSFSGWETEPGDTIAVMASVSGGLLETESLIMEAGPISLAAHGDWRFANGSGGAIQYALVVSSLEPLSPYLPADAQGRQRFTTGSLRAEGTVAGTLDRPELAGDLAASDFRYGEWAAESLEGTYALEITDGLPLGDATVTGTDIRTPGADLADATLVASIDRPLFTVSLVGEQLDGGAVAFEADGRIEETGAREVLLRTAELDLESQRWRLPSPARISWTEGETVFVEGLRLTQIDGDGIVQVDGVLAPADETDLEVLVRRLPVGDLVALVGVDLPVTGDLYLEGTIRGPETTPLVELTANLRDGSVRDVAVGTADLTLLYTGSDLEVDGTAVLGDSALVDVEGTVPVALTLGFPPSVELLDDGALALTLDTEEFPLATLDPGIRSVQDLEGLVTANVRLAGTPADPLLDGDLELVGGAVTVTLMDKRYTEIEGSAVLEGRELRIATLSGTSGGTATVEGGLIFEELTDPSLDLVATLTDFEPQNAPGASDVEASGTISLAGTARSPVVSGNVTLRDGTVSVVPFLGGRADFSERLVGVAESFDFALPDELEGGPEPGTGLRIEALDVQAGADTWFATEEARAQLEGGLRISSVGDEFTIFGELTGQQGTFNLRVGPVARTFEIVNASIRFLGGPEPDPALDVTASRIIRTTEGGSVDVRARVTGSASNPQLDLSTAEGVAVAQSEILSYVLFGRPTFAVSELAPGQAGYEELFAFTGALDRFATWAQSDVLRDLDLDLFQLEMRSEGGNEFSFTSFWVIAGWQATDEIFLTTEFPVDEPTGRLLVSADWRIDRQWTLEAALAPVRYISAGATGSLPTALTGSQRQWLLVLRRRWTY